MNANLKAILLFLVVFFTGIVFGGAVTYLYVRSVPQLQQPPRGSEGHSERNREAFVQKMRAELGVDDTQHEKIMGILAAARDKFRAENARSREETARLRQETREQIMEVLRPEQREKFKALLAKFDKNEDSRRGRRRSGPVNEDPPASGSDSAETE